MENDDDLFDTFDEWENILNKRRGQKKREISIEFQK